MNGIIIGLLTLIGMGIGLFFGGFLGVGLFAVLGFLWFVFSDEWFA